MDITISVSEKTEHVIREKAEENGRDLADFAGDLLEEKVKEEYPEEIDIEGPHPLLKFAGMFSSGKTDTSERMHEILYSEDFDPGRGFSIK